MAQWIGYMVSIKCVDNRGTYQGEIIGATDSTITLSKAFCNGIPCATQEVVVKAEDIMDLQLIDKQESPTGRSTVSVTKPVAKRASRTISMSEITANKSYNNVTGPHNRSKPIDIEVRQNINDASESYNKLSLNDCGGSYRNGTPSKKEKFKGKWTKGWKDEACFGSPLDQTINKDFDFEKNLALFDKQAIWDELNHSQKPDVIRQTDQSRRQQTTKYRHDENILATVPTTYRQITVPKQEFCEYVTDEGLIIPSISQTLRNKLWTTADRLGLTWERRIELMGRATCEMALQLVGGGHRINPHNMHQCPTVVVLCGPHRQGLMGLNAARQLATHGVNTVVYISTTDCPGFKEESSLYRLTRNKMVTSVSSLPQLTDLIVLALCEDTDLPRCFNDLVNWANNNKAPVLAIDPPVVGSLGILTKFSLVPVLPLAYTSDNGKIYLCNLGFPVAIFSEVGIKYKSPFGSKFVIPLHPNDD